MQKIGKTLKNLFIPHEGNDHKPHVLRGRVIAAVILLSFIAEATFLFGASYIGPRSSLFGTIIVSALTDGTNTARTTDNLPTLHVSPLLQAAAQEKANDMVKNGYFAHTSPAGITPWYWFENVGYSFIYAGENLAVNFSDSQDVTNAWLNSPEHRANILNGNFTEIGIATAEGTFQGHDAIYVVELFGTPSILPVVAAAPSAATPSKPAVAFAQKPVIIQATPSVIATSSLLSSSSNQTFVAVKAAEAQQVLGSASSAVPTPVVAPIPAPTVATTPAMPETNIVQRIAANPRAALDDFYYFLALLFGFALALNVFIKVRIQYPNFILGGVVVVSMAGIFLLLNQQFITGVLIK